MPSKWHTDHRYCFIRVRDFDLILLILALSVVLYVILIWRHSIISSFLVTWLWICGTFLRLGGNWTFQSLALFRIGFLGLIKCVLPTMLKDVSMLLVWPCFGLFGLFGIGCFLATTSLLSLKFRILFSLNRSFGLELEILSFVLIG